MPAQGPANARLGSNAFTGPGTKAAARADLSAAPQARTSAVAPPADTTAPKRKGGPAKGTLCRGRVDMASLKIVKKKPLPVALTTSSYAERFSTMEPGDAIECKPDEVVAVANAMRKWINESGKQDDLQVISEKVDPKNPAVGTVWMCQKGDIKSLPAKSRGGVVVGRIRKGSAS